jgi:hypothetical protein
MSHGHPGTRSYGLATIETVQERLLPIFSAATRDPYESELGKSTSSTEKPTFPHLKKPVVSGVCALWRYFYRDGGQPSSTVDFILRNVKLETRFLVRAWLLSIPSSRKCHHTD